MCVFCKEERPLRPQAVSAGLISLNSKPTKTVVLPNPK